jgi:hypothetical protein
MKNNLSKRLAHLLIISCSNSYRKFREDFENLEQALRKEKANGGCVMTPERMVVELRLQPRLVRNIEKQYHIKLPWFLPVYTALEYHRLLPWSKSWDKWLVRYRAKQKAFKAKTNKLRAEVERLRTHNTKPGN